MGGYRLESDAGGSVQVTDLGTGVVLDLVDLGLAFEHWPGQHVLARARRGDTARPDVRVATTAGGRGHGRPGGEAPARWVETVGARARSLERPRGFSLMDETDILSDLPVRAFFGLLEADQIPWYGEQEDGLFADDDIARSRSCADCWTDSPQRVSCRRSPGRCSGRCCSGRAWTPPSRTGSPFLRSAPPGAHLRDASRAARGPVCRLCVAVRRVGPVTI